jgi:hypoxanthine phosphoribosyltransferase
MMSVDEQPTGFVFRHYRGERPPLFNHSSEFEFAKVLEQCELGWEYEPHVFVLRARTEMGEEVEVGPDQLVNGSLPSGWEVSEAFRPDFYLPDQNVYFETTVMKQSLTTRKNHKARLTRERYGVQVQIIYRRDFEALAREFHFELPPEQHRSEPTTEVETSQLSL